MIFHERLAALGVDLSDLPELAAYPIEREMEMIETVQAEDDLPLDYTLRLIDIIDRMEMRLINLIGERDWLAAYYEDNELMPWYGVPEDWRADDDP